MTHQGRIMKGLGGLYTVRDQEGRLWECSAKGIFRKKGLIPYVGDEVELEEDAEQGKGVISTIFPRRTFLARPPVANLDQAVLVSATVEPAPNLLVLDRMIAIAECKGVSPVLVFTKTDLASPEKWVAIYHNAGFPVLTACPQSPLEGLIPHLSGHLTVFAGNTGVGKSTLLNALLPGLGLSTGEISRKLGRGRHTTRHVELFPVGEGGLVADTPGFSSFDPEQGEIILKEALPRAFREFAPYIDQCRFTGCSHTCEKGCAVLAALKAGKIEPSRHASYCTLYQEVKDIKEWELNKKEAFSFPPLR